MTTTEGEEIINNHTTSAKQRQGVLKASRKCRPCAVSQKIPRHNATHRSYLEHRADVSEYCPRQFAVVRVHPLVKQFLPDVHGHD